MLRIDPGVAQVWSSPTTLRFGARAPVLVISPIERTQEILIHALTAGTTRRALDAVAVQAGATSSDVGRLLELLAPVLIADASTASLSVAVERTLPWPVRAAGVDTGVARAVASVGGELVGRQDRPDLAVVIGAHLIAPAVASYWLGRDIPLLPVVLTERAIEVGPLVVPGVTACLHCLACHLMDEDSSWPLIAAQLLDPAIVEPLPVEPIAALDAAATVARAVRALLGSRATGLEGVTVRFDDEGGVSRRDWAPHPRCSCRALRGNVTAFERPSGAARSAPTRVGAPGGRG